MKIRYLLLIVILTAGWLTNLSCRKKYFATDEDMSTYGWVLYEQGDYLGSNQWFKNAVLEDTTHQDGYNGLGWSFGKILLADSSQIYFKGGLKQPPDPWSETNVLYEILAGLCFSSNAAGNDSGAVLYGDSLLASALTALAPSWTFSHDTTINHLDVRLTLAASNFGVSNFSASLTQVQAIYEEINPQTTFTANVTTVEGRRKLAVEIEALQAFLASR